MEGRLQWKDLRLDRSSIWPKITIPSDAVDRPVGQSGCASDPELRYGSNCCLKPNPKSKALNKYYSNSILSRNWIERNGRNGRNGNEFRLFERISFDKFSAEYDKQFFNRLRQLSRQLKIFVTKESKQKARIWTHVAQEDREEENRDLIKKINSNLRKTNEFLKRKDRTNGLNHLNELPALMTQTMAYVKTIRVNSSIRTKNSLKTTPKASTESKSSRTMSQTSSDTTPAFVRRYIESLGQTEPTFATQFRFDSQVWTQYTDPCDSGQQMAGETDEDNDSDSDIQIVNRHKWSNTDYAIGTGIILKDEPENKVRTQHKRHKQIGFVLERIKSLIESNTYCTKRDLYYQNVVLFDKSQRVVDEIIDDLACSLRVSRYRLHITSSTRGLVFGHLTFQNTNGVLTDCLSSPNGIAVPNETERLARLQSKALFVLIVEKDATFQQLIDLKIHQKYPLIMVTGHGYPDLNTRAFVQILWNTLEIPIFGLVDGDAHGVEILCTFRHGSLALSYESSNLVAPAIRWLGILPSDIAAFKLSTGVQIPLKETDKKKIEDLKARTYMKENEEWTQQLDLLLKIGKKVEIQSLAEHSPTFLLDIYLPQKIRYGSWI